MRVGSARYSLVALSLALCCAALISPAAAAEPTGPRPNILFIIMDDVGIDQLSTLGYGGATPPATPNINQIANAGVRFRNTWAMPACSTSRAVLFEGRARRFPSRRACVKTTRASGGARARRTRPRPAFLPRD